MMKLMRKQLSNQRGVTLIELLAVIVILGILAAVAVPAVMSQIGTSKDGAWEANTEILNDAIERYYLLNGEYPKGSESALPTGTDGVANVITALKAEPTTDTDGNVINKGGPFLKADFPTKAEYGTWNIEPTTKTKIIWEAPGTTTSSTSS